MLSFSHPFFLLLLPVAGLIVWRWSRRRLPAAPYPDATLLSGLPSGRARLARFLSLGLRAAGLGCLVIALAGPRWPDLGSRLPTEGIAIEMVVDASGSMATPDFHWNGQTMTRLDAVKKAFRLFVEGSEAGQDETGRKGEEATAQSSPPPAVVASPRPLLEGRPNDLIGLVTFARWPQTSCPLTLSHSVLLRLMDAEKPRTIPTESESNIGDAIAWALVRLEKAKTKRKVMILLSDGEHNVPPPALTPRQAAQLAASQGVPIYAIDAGGITGASEGADAAPGQTSKESLEAIRASAEKTMAAIAQITGGRHFKVHDAESLLQVCQEIDRLERQEIKSFQYRRYFEGYGVLGMIAFGLLAGVGLLELTVLRKAP
jgi:Ca-activated chloride channel homolog